MSPEDFRRLGHRLVDWIADYRASIEARPVRSQVEPGWVRDALARPVPEAPPEDIDDELSRLIADLDQVIAPGISHFQHPHYYAYFPANAGLASVLGDLVSTGLGTVGLNWEAAPALTELETLMCDWYRVLFGLDSGWHGAIHDTASSASLVAMLCARERASDFALDRGGVAETEAPLCVYASQQAHSSIDKAVLLAGFGRKYFVRVPTTADYAMDPEALDAQIRRDVERGWRPAAVVATVGTTGVTAIDPIRKLAAVAHTHGVWLHVDAAMAGAAAILPEQRAMFDGLEGADSVVINAHKWFGTVFDCSLMYVRDVEHLVRCMSTDPSYLRSRGGDVIQYRNWGLPLGRRFRALKMWFHLRLEGADAIRTRLREDIEHAAWLQKQVEAEPGWRLVAPRTLQTVCLRHEPDGWSADEIDAHTLRWVGDINQSGFAYLTAAKLDGRWMVRVSIGAEATQRHHVQALWTRMKTAASASKTAGSAATA
ncbi:MAG: pyridoxal-dependent decarboxylase [Myxococcota bacterium]